uniref:Uncharacterized protein n=1 Tax=Siphoviridae sp. ctDyb2 TaxID=2826201 RepID=A0A8S5MC57_9CAUD|nr:MAG TPA: hypothetical protein [Siphoviridae sp. ctDyb2]
MKKRTRIVRNHPAYDPQRGCWVRVLAIQRKGLLEVATLNGGLLPPYLVEADQVELWHPEADVNEVRLEALIWIPVGSRITVGDTDYTRVIRGWLEQEYDELAEYEYSRFLPDPGVEDKALGRWQLDCNNHAGTPYFLELPK